MALGTRTRLDTTTRVTDFDYISLRLASPDAVRAWSHGEVTKAETINYRTQRPEKDGLFDERIFGPEKDYECYCGKYKRVRFRGVVCDKCGVEVTRSSVRRERMGHIALASPVTHIWFLRGVPSRIGGLLGISLPSLERVVYFNGYIITHVDEEARERVLKAIEQEFKQKHSKAKDKKAKKKLKEAHDRATSQVKDLTPLRVISEAEYFDLSMRYAEVFTAGTGAQVVRELLEGINMSELESELSLELESATKAQQKKLLKRLKLVRKMRVAGVKPEWTVLTVLPVLPPDLRPMVQLDGGRFATSDLNDLYRRVINRNNRLKHLQSIGAPEVIQRNEKRMLQEAVDALIDNSMRRGSSGPARGAGRRPLRSLADMLSGKQGRLRQNLLGKRVDYSGRSVIVVGASLSLDECGLPKGMAMEIFKPFVIQKLIDYGYAFNIRGAITLIERGATEAWAALEEVTEDKYVLLNRAPTLHRLSIQAFKPVLIEGSAIQLHPLVCPAFNADFDGDQMAVHLPISRAAQRESEEIMLASRNLLKPASGLPIAVPRHEIVLGIYVMTRLDGDPHEPERYFTNTAEARLAYDLGQISLHEPIGVKLEKSVAENPARLKDAASADEPVVTTVGRVLFNETFPEPFPFVNTQLKQRDVERLIEELIGQFGIDQAPQILDAIKNIGFEYATHTSVTWGMDDLTVPEAKPKLVGDAIDEVEELREAFDDGMLTNDERRERTIGVWRRVTDEIAGLVPESTDPLSPVFSIADSGARGSWAQPRQMAGMKGPVVNPSGQIMEVPVISSFTEGLNVLEYFISTHGARKGTTDTALRTATAGYLTRRLEYVAEEVVVTEEDCKTKNGVTVHREDSEETGQKFGLRLIGRAVREDIKDGRKTLVKKGEVISESLARTIDQAGVDEVSVRSPLTCDVARGICRQCYGWDLGKNELVKMGEAVGVVAAQAIGEPGTQLTMRTFHTGGVAIASDITQGLLRVEEIFEARQPKGRAMISNVSGVVSDIQEDGDDRVVVVEVAERTAERKKKRRKKKKGKKDKKKDKKKDMDDIETFHVSQGAKLLVKKGDAITPGAQLTHGSIDLRELYRYAGIRATERYILREVQRIYASAGPIINDKHIEVVIRQMFSRMKISDAGDSDFTPGEMVPRSKLFEVSAEIKDRSGKMPEASPVLLGITRAALASESFLAAASFQETSRVLIRSALSGAVDRLLGLKENIIIGKLIPAGTGYRREYVADAYVGTEPSAKEEEEEEEEERGAVIEGQRLEAKEVS